MLGKTDFDLFPEDVATGFREKDKEMLSQRRTQRNDEWVTYPDGHRVLLETVKTPLYDGDGAQCPMTGFTSPVRIFGWMVGRCRDRCVSVGSAPTAARSLILLQHCLEFSHTAVRANAVAQELQSWRLPVIDSLSHGDRRGYAAIS